MKTEQTKLTKKQQIALISKISSRLSDSLDNITWSNIYTNYLKENIQDEKNHLKFKPESCKHGLTAREGGMFFAVKNIIEFFDHKNVGLKSVYIPKVEDYLSVRKTIFSAFAIVAKYNDELKEALKDIDYREVLNMDYVELVQTDKNGVTFPEYKY